MADTFGNTTTTGATPVTPVTPASPGLTGAGPDTTDTAETAGTSGTAEAKSRFSAALEEAKAGAAALGTEARNKASAYRDQAKTTGDTWSSDAKSKASELAAEGKAKASEALSSLGRLVGDNAPVVDEKLGAKYGDYVRTASHQIEDTATRLESKSVDELGDDFREFVRASPRTAVGLAALAGYLFARVLRK